MAKTNQKQQSRPRPRCSPPRSIGSTHAKRAFVFLTRWNLLDALIWASDQATSEGQYQSVISLLRASLPSVGAALESANDALGDVRIGKFVYSKLM